MAKSKPVRIGNTNFAKKGDALLYLQKMLNSYAIGDKVSEPDTLFLLDALVNHPEQEDKIGVGVAHMVVRLADHGTRCFWIVRKDGTEKKFSYKSCV